jgi:hypothetical protein
MYLQRRQHVKRLALTALALVLAGLLVAATGATAGGQNVSWRLGGTAEWSGPGFLAETFSIHGSVDGGTYSGTLHAGPYFTTPTCGPQCAPVTGTIDFATRQGTFTANVEPEGLVSVVSIGSGTTYSFALTLRVVSGTKSFAHAGGTLSLTYESHLPTNQPNCSVCPIEDGGTLTGNMERGPSA